MLGVAPQLAEAFHNGGGIAFGEYHPEMIDAIDRINRGNYQQRFTDYWLKAIPEVMDKLNRGGAALDVGCGVGVVSLTLAEAFPNSHFVGIDTHENSITKAMDSAKASGKASNIHFKHQSIDALDEQFDLITLCDCLHDLIQPEAVLNAIKQRLKPEGVLFIIEPKVEDNLEENINPIAAMLYGFSVFHCMTQSLAEGGPGLGACMGPAKTESLVRDAGFTSFEMLSIKSQFNHFYAARV